MIRLLIVDDETATRNGLLRHIDWRALGVDMVQAAGSGQEGLAMCEEFQPDLVLSDIRMRGMNGVEMCTLLHEKYPECRIIFISGYSDKEYLKAAIELGAVQYVEKPVDREELQKAVRKALTAVFEARRHRKADEQIQKSAESVKRDALFSLLRGEAVRSEETVQGETGALPTEEFPCLRAGVLRMSAPVSNLRRFRDRLWEEAGIPPAVPGGPRLYGEFWDNRRMVLLLCGTQAEVADDGLLLSGLKGSCERGLLGNRLFLALGQTVQAAGEVELSYRRACEVEKTVFFLEYGRVAFEPGSNAVPALSQNYALEFRRCLERGEEEEARALLEKLEGELRAARAVNSAAVRNLYFELERELQHRCNLLFPSGGGNSEELERNAQQLELLDSLTAVSESFLSRLAGLTARSSREESNSFAVQKVLRLIRQHYGDKNLSVRQLAENVYLTPTYLSGLFKRQTGTTVGETITQVRMERARELLQDASLRLYQVAEQVGYEDANYFAKIFKKQTGMTPSEYRERVGV